jgi:hypothetical protein
MTVIDMLSSMQQIQSRLVSLTGTPPASTTASASSATFDQLVASQSSSATSSTSTGGPTGADVVADAKKYLGIPYVLDGESTSGMDCSGLVQKTYKDLGVTLPRGVREQKTMGTAVPSLAQARPGDLIVFKGGGHIAIYAGNNTVIHAPYPGRTVSEQKLWVGDAGIETIRRIVPSASTASAAPAAASTTSVAAQSAAVTAAQATLQADIAMLQSLAASAGSLGSLGSLGTAGATGTLGTTGTLGMTSTGTTDPSSLTSAVSSGVGAIGSLTPADEIAQFMAMVNATVQQGIS